MNIYWTSIFIASLFEVLWVIGLKYADTLFEWICTICGIIITFVLISFASKKIPVGTNYAVFVGLGTMGTFLSDIFLFGAVIKISSIIFLALLLSSVTGLKVITQMEEKVSKKIEK